jgi:hypothetical protein
MNELGPSHEWRHLASFRRGDRIHRWGDDLLVVYVHEHLDGRVELIYVDTDGKEVNFIASPNAEYIASVERGDQANDDEEADEAHEEAHEAGNDTLPFREECAWCQEQARVNTP